ncbi:hypothetical protein KN1_11710 [Stygiolobus caldivivus]|uniref:HEPN domain-containing protein n=2 Tax=Stygiolobus caldivivus TaxID=2824673 RepID=A0A8D5U5V5_9CREN|nr:hypothetical protein KN1_11710 [Stygiolobus caldivivus]
MVYSWIGPQTPRELLGACTLGSTSYQRAQYEKVRLTDLTNRHTEPCLALNVPDSLDVNALQRGVVPPLLSQRIIMGDKTYADDPLTHNILVTTSYLMSFLLNNAKTFLHDAKRDFEEGIWNLSVFHSEQALQLCIKYKLYTHLGDFPKTHNLKELITDLKKFEPVEVDELMLDFLTQSYISSRYLPYTFSKESAEKALKFVEDLMRWLKCL